MGKHPKNVPSPAGPASELLDGFLLPGAVLGGDAGWREEGGFFGRRVGRQALDDLGQVFLGIEILDTAVWPAGVDQGIVFSGFEAAKEVSV
ncbi:MAG TPA: hypothetical protein VF258_05470 [Luteolibacter sp.]